MSVVQRVLLGTLAVWLIAGGASAQEKRQATEQAETKLPALLTVQPLPEDSQDDELRKLLKARYNEAVGEVRGLLEIYRTGRSNLDAFVDVGQRLVQSRLDLNDTPAEKVSLLTQFVELTREAEKITQARYEAGRASITELHRARYQTLDAQIQLLRARQAADPKAK